MASTPHKLTLAESLISVSTVVNRALLHLSAAIILLMAVLIFAAVVSRNVFSVPIVWVDELISGALPLITLLVGSSLIASRDHVAIDYLPKRATGWRSDILEVLFWASCIAVSGALTYSGISSVKYLFEKGIRSPSLLGLPDWIMQTSIPIGSVLMLFSSIVGAIGHITHRGQNQAE